MNRSLWLSLILLLSLVVMLGCGSDDETTVEGCSVDTVDGGTVITCPDGTESFIDDPGDAVGCELTDHNDGTYTVDCEGSEPVTLRDGADGEDGADGSDGADGADGEDGADGADGQDAQPCEVDEDDGVITLTCPDDSVSFEVPEPVEICQVTDNDDGTYTLDCEGSEPITLSDGEDSEPCSVIEDDDGVTIICPDGSEASLEPAAACEVTDHDDGTYTIDCAGSEPVTIRDGEDGAPGSPGSSGSDGESCTIDEDEGEITLTCGNDTVVFTATVCGNGVVHDTQVCDDGSDNGSCEFGAGEVSCEYCRTDCSGYDTDTRTLVDGTVVSVRELDLGVEPDVTLEVGGVEVTTDDEGKFEVTDLEPGIHSVHITSGEEGWNSWWDTYPAPSETSRLAPQLMHVEVFEAGTITPLVVRTLEGLSESVDYDGSAHTHTVLEDTDDYLSGPSTGAAWWDLSIEFGADSIVDDSGDDFSGEMEVTVYPVFMPTTSGPSSEFWTYSNLAIPHPANSDDERLEILAAMAIELRDADTGAELEIADDGDVTAHISGDHRADLPASSWWFDEEQGSWIQVEEDGVTDTDKEAGTESGGAISQLDDIDWGVFSVDIDRTGWWSVADVDVRDWTCIIGDASHSGMAVSSHHERGNSHGTSDDDEFCIDVPVADTVTLQGHAHRSALERYYGTTTVNTNSAAISSCSDGPIGCVNIGDDLELEDLNGYCMDVTDGQFGIQSSSENLEGTFHLEQHGVELPDFPATTWNQPEFGISNRYLRQYTEVSASAGTCVPLYWRDPMFRSRDLNEHHCDQPWAFLREAWNYLDNQSSPIAPICGGGSGTDDCANPADDDEYFFCGS